MLSILRKIGGSLILRISKLFVEQDKLKELTITTPERASYNLAQLMSEMPDEWPMVKEWDEMTPMGKETL